MVTTMMGRISMATIQFRIVCLNRYKGDNLGGKKGVGTDCATVVDSLVTS